MSQEYIVLDLFSGARGLLRGFLDASYNVVLGVVFEEMELKTFKENQMNEEAMKLNLFEHANIKQVENFFEKNNYKLNVLVGVHLVNGFR